MRKRAKWFRLIGFALLMVAGAAGQLMGQDVAIISQEDIFHPVVAKNGMVATQEHYATQAGLDLHNTMRQSPIADTPCVLRTRRIPVSGTG